MFCTYLLSKSGLIGSIYALVLVAVPFVGAVLRDNEVFEVVASLPIVYAVLSPNAHWTQLLSFVIEFAAAEWLFLIVLIIVSKVLGLGAAALSTAIAGIIDPAEREEWGPKTYTTLIMSFMASVVSAFPIFAAISYIWSLGEKLQ